MSALCVPPSHRPGAAPGPLTQQHPTSPPPPILPQPAQPYLQDQQWTEGMNFPVKEGWRPWMVENQVAGYVTEYAPPSGVRFTFATVKQAGHEVPMYQPLRGLAMVQRFLAGVPL